MDAGHGVAEKKFQDYLLSAGELCNQMQKLSKGSFTMDDFEQQFSMRIQLSDLIGEGSTQEEWFQIVSQASQCLNCGGFGVHTPKMLTCSACKCVQYCSKTCQRQDWKNGHKRTCTEKSMPKDLFRVAYFCSKMLSVLSAGENIKEGVVTDADSSLLHRAILKSGCKDRIYMPVFEDDTLMYIPMCLKFVTYLMPELGNLFHDDKAFLANNNRFVIAVQTNIPVVEKAHTGYGFLMRDTHVHMQ